MLDKIKRQEEEIMFLSDELDRLRARTLSKYYKLLFQTTLKIAAIFLLRSAEVGPNVLMKEHIIEITTMTTNYSVGKKNGRFVCRTSFCCNVIV